MISSPVSCGSEIEIVLAEMWVVEVRWLIGVVYVFDSYRGCGELWPPMLSAELNGDVLLSLGRL